MRRSKTRFPTSLFTFFFTFFFTLFFTLFVVPHVLRCSSCPWACAPPDPTHMPRLSYVSEMPTAKESIARFESALGSQYAVFEAECTAVAKGQAVAEDCFAAVGKACHDAGVAPEELIVG